MVSFCVRVNEYGMRRKIAGANSVCTARHQEVDTGTSCRSSSSQRALLKRVAPIETGAVGRLPRETSPSET